MNGSSITTEHREEKRHLRERSHTITRHTFPSTGLAEPPNNVEEGDSAKHFADTTDDLATINDQIQGLMVPSEEVLEDEEDYSDDESAVPTTGQASPKSLLSTTSSMVSYVSSASAYDILLSRLGNSQVDPFARPETVDQRINDEDDHNSPRVSHEVKEDTKDDEDADWGNILHSNNRLILLFLTLVCCIYRILGKGHFRFQVRYRQRAVILHSTRNP